MEELNVIGLIVRGERYFLTFDNESIACARQVVRCWLDDTDLDFHEAEAELFLDKIDEFDPASGWAWLDAC